MGRDKPAVPSEAARGETDPGTDRFDPRATDHPTGEAQAEANEKNEPAS